MSVNQLKSQRKSIKSSINTFNNRKQAVQRIINNIDNGLDDNVSGVNSEIGKCLTELVQGVKGTSRVTTVCNNLSSLTERYVGSDGCMSSCRGNLISEVSRCQGQASSLSSQVTSLESQIRSQGGKIYFWE